MAIWMALAALVGGCASQKQAPPEPAPVSVTTIDAGGYARAFDAARDALREQGFTLDRIDARAGVIQTRPAPSSQLRPMLRSFNDRLRRVSESLAHRHRRIGEARFVAQGADGAGDLTQWGGSMRLEMRVRVERLHRFDTRVEPVSIRLSSVSSHALSGRSDDSIGVSYLKDDTYMASRMLESVTRALGTSENSD
jgi:hypothetical protein